MKLNRLKIANCSRVADIDIAVRDNMVLIGPNGSGKTTVLLCLDMLLGMSDQQLRAALSREFIRDASRPLVVEAVLGSLNDDERAAFQGALVGKRKNSVAVRLEVRASGGEGGKAGDNSNNNADITIKRSLPGSSAQAGPTEAQKAAFGWTFLQDQSTLGGNDPDGTPQAADAVPTGDVWLKAREDVRMQHVSEHPSGIRSLFAMTICDVLQDGVDILAIDEPEVHLHPSSQRSLAKMLKSHSGQRILVTHSPTIAGSFEPDEIVVIRLDGTAVQPKEGFLSGDAGTLARWWIGRQLEPLTAGAVIAVEGPSDRIIVSKAATALGFDLDRHDVVIVETSGCGDMKFVESIFGRGGFGIPLYELIDEDAADDVAKRLGTGFADLQGRNIFVSAADLEDEYVHAIGAKVLWDRLKAAGTFSPNVFRRCRLERDGYPTEASLAQFIREKSNRKIPCALAASELITEANASGLKSISRLMDAVTSWASKR
ncbi:MAG: AAA family ATPase [Eggerthellaceae bacterium]|nr:AAA family ATPase [Eggerthellaceae bacterium]